MIEFDELFEKHCRNCVNNEKDHWCMAYGCNPCKALTLCKSFDFELEEKKEE